MVTDRPAAFGSRMAAGGDTVPAGSGIQWEGCGVMIMIGARRGSARPGRAEPSNGQTWHTKNKRSGKAQHSPAERSTATARLGILIRKEGLLHGINSSPQGDALRRLA